MRHFRNPMRGEQREQSLGSPDKTKPRRGNDTFAPRRARGAMERARFFNKNYQNGRNNLTDYFFFCENQRENLSQISSGTVSGRLKFKNTQIRNTHEKIILIDTNSPSRGNAQRKCN